MFFRDVIGQEEIKQRLIQEVNEGRIPHAQLICGPEGVGKMPLAIAYARYISCTNRGETDACGTCQMCIRDRNIRFEEIESAIFRFQLYLS